MPSRHILIVEDSEFVADALRLLFEADGHRVSTAGSVAAGNALAQTDPVDVLFLDLTLPDGDGLRVIRDLPPTQRPDTIIVMTGHDDAITQARCLAAGCHQVLVKPVPIAELRAVVTSL